MADNHVIHVHDLYSKLRFYPPHGQFTVIAAFILFHPDMGEKTISLASGTKCLPDSRRPICGDALHDSHAEVLSRRGAVRWFLQEAMNCDSVWMAEDGGKLRLKPGVMVQFYVSTLPCGDASTRYLASIQDESMATLKDSTIRPPADKNVASRGRDNYSLYGVLRTKPGRADSPPTTSMSCSDKIARWNVLGFQGALASRLFHPIYISQIIIGDVPETMHGAIRDDCMRAFAGRLEPLDDLPGPFCLARPEILFTSVPFRHSSKPDSRGSCNESLCWVADSPTFPEVLINGMKRGVSPKHRHREKSRPSLSKLALFNLFEKASLARGLEPTDDATTYSAAKAAVVEYQAVKESLQGESGPFCGWIRSGSEWENFTRAGVRGSQQ